MPARKRVDVKPHYMPAKRKRNDLEYLWNRYQRLAAWSRPDKPETENAADLALADLLIAGLDAPQTQTIKERGEVSDDAEIARTGLPWLW